MEMRERGVDGGEVLLNDGIAALAVGLLDRRFDLCDRLLSRKHAAERKEARLHDRVDPAAHPGFVCDGISVDYEQTESFRDELITDRVRQLVPHLVRSIRTVQQEGCAVRSEVEHRIPF